MSAKPHNAQEISQGSNTPFKLHYQPNIRNYDPSIIDSVARWFSSVLYHYLCPYSIIFCQEEGASCESCCRTAGGAAGGAGDSAGDGGDFGGEVQWRFFFKVGEPLKHVLLGWTFFKGGLIVWILFMSCLPVFWWSKEWIKLTIDKPWANLNKLKPTVVEGSLEIKVPTIWPDEKAQPGRSRARKTLGCGESQKGEDKRWRKSEERRCRCAKR